MTSAARLDRRELERLRQSLGAQDWTVLAEVQQRRLLTGRQLQLLHFGTSPASARAARRCLLRLSNAGPLVRLQRRVGGVRAGSDGFIYTLGRVGRRLLAPDRPVRSAFEVSDGFLRHTLAVNDVVVALHQQTQHGRSSLERCQSEPASWRRIRGTTGELVKPDLLVITGNSEQAQHSFVEVDLATEHRAAIQRKLRMYERSFRFGFDGDDEVHPRVVWLVPSEQRKRWLEGVIRAGPAFTSGLHVVTLQDDLTCLWPLGGRSEEQLTPEGGEHE